jgi:shikimate dehydrogenase
MHNAAFKAAGMNRVFIPLQVADLDVFISRMVKPATREVELNFKGFSVTNPHKQAIIDHLDGIDDTAAKIGAVNTVTIDDGKLFGFNTDAPGFIDPLIERYGNLEDAKAAVVGAGGAARACVYALQNEGANVTLFARDLKKAAVLGEEFSIPVKDLASDRARFECDILVNATPLGTKGENEKETIATAEQLLGTRLVYDLVYNPIETALIREARTAGVPAIGGLEMVIAQGTRQFYIWTGQPAPADEMTAAIKRNLTYDPT